MYDLNRIKVDTFVLEEALNFEELEKNKNNIEDYLIKMEDILKDFDKIELPFRKKDLFFNGVKLSGYQNFKDGTYHIYIDNHDIGLGIVKEETLKRDVIV